MSKYSNNPYSASPGFENSLESTEISNGIPTYNPKLTVSTGGSTSNIQSMEN